jgi:probable phosphoglycerate mutase
VTVLIVRHGETPWTREGRVQGWAAVPLTDRGRDQARAAGRYLASEHDPARVVASDVRRTKETATLVVDELGAVPLETDAGWRERHFGPQQGFSDERYDADEEPMDVGDTVAFGEDWDDLDDRVNDAWDRLDRTVDTVVVTHNGPVWRLTDRLTDDAHGVDPGEVVVVEGDAVREVVSPVERES